MSANAKATWRGSWVALVTPMNADGSVNYDDFRKLIDWQIAEGTQGLIPCGNTGEFPATIEDDEWEELVKVCVQHTNKRVPVLPGAGTYSTKKTAGYCKKAQELGADGVLLCPPFYNKPTQEGIFQHFKACADACGDFPIILYNVPGRVVVDIAPDTMARLSRIPSIVGVKEASEKLERYDEYKAVVVEDFLFFSGADPMGLDLLLRGAHGNMPVSGNALPKLCRQLSDLALAGKKEEATAVNEKLKVLFKVIFIEANPQPVKFLLMDKGLIGPGIRLPLLPLSEKHHDTMRAAIAQADN
jgi:4-hydroxy-tetrahydrodipicolinate synthase